MHEILFIKTSSLGDVIHHMPAVTDASRLRPDARLCWVVEEAFAPLVRLHPAISEVIPVASRRWRRSLWRPAPWREISGFIGDLRQRQFEAVIDTQGLVRTALISRAARGVRHGYEFGSIRERPAAAFYDVRHRVDRGLHAVARNRLLTALALGGAPEGEADYGLDRDALRPVAGRPYAVLLHATSRVDKLWPQERWIALGKILTGRGLDLVLPWGDANERLRSEALAAALPRAIVPERRPLDDVAQLLAGASLVIGVDTGLMHLAAALSVPLVGIFTRTEPGLTGPVGPGPIAVAGGRDASPSVEDVAAAMDRLAL